MGAVLLSLAASAADAQTSAPPKKKVLDERSVLLEWSEGSQTQAVPVKAVAAEPPENLNPEVEAIVDEALAAMNRGQVDDAITGFRKTLTMDPRHRRARFGIGTALIQMFRYREALDVLEPLAAEFPDDFFVKNNIAWVYATARDLGVRDGAKAVRYAQDALFVAPNSYQVWNTLSEAYYVMGEYERSARAAEEAVRISTAANVAPASVQDYRRQAEKARRAARAMSLVE